MKEAWARKKATQNPLSPGLRRDFNLNYGNTPMLQGQGQYPAQPPQHPYPTPQTPSRIGSLDNRTNQVRVGFAELMDRRQNYTRLREYITSLDPQEEGFGKAIEEYNAAVNAFLDQLATYFVVTNL